MNSDRMELKFGEVVLQGVANSAAFIEEISRIAKDFLK